MSDIIKRVSIMTNTRSNGYYRSLDINEIEIMERQGCCADDWTRVTVADGFDASFMRNVRFYGDVAIGETCRQIEVEEGFMRHSGIYNATLRNTQVGDNCLIENIAGYINNCTIGDDCYISNVGLLTTTGGATFGEGIIIAVLNEAGHGNVIIYDNLSSQMAAAMVKWNKEKPDIFASIKKMATKHAEQSRPEQTTIGYGVKIINTKELVNVAINDFCEINGASRISDCTLTGQQQASIYIGNDCILENTIVQPGASITDGAKVSNCLIGEACHVGKGFSAESTVVFANSHLDNGEACATFCGPFTVSHHKATLLIGTMLSFYNAGSATNYSNHAYKMGPIHYGTLSRGCKTASGTHILLPANIGDFSMIMGKITCHPDTTALPFSYIIANGNDTFIVPARNVATMGTWRDIGKWEKRDQRPQEGRIAALTTDWLNPATMQKTFEGRRLLMTLKEQGNTDDCGNYLYNGCLITPKALDRGIQLYDMLIKMAMGNETAHYGDQVPNTITGMEKWIDIGGMALPASCLEDIENAIGNGDINDIAVAEEMLSNCARNYDDHKWAWTYRTILNYHQWDSMTQEDARQVRDEGKEATATWKQLIREDAEKEFALGDVDEETLIQHTRI